MNLSLISVLLFLVSSPLVFANGMSPIEKNIFELKYISIRVADVENDMSLPIGWGNSQKEWKQPAQKAVVDLKIIKQDLMNLTIPPELEDLKPKMVNIIDRLTEAYTGIENKPKQQIKSGMDSFWEESEKFIDDVKEKAGKYLKLTLPKNITDEENKIFKDDNDRQAYIKALNLIKQKKYKDAHTILQGLFKKYRGQILEANIVSRIVDCSEMSNEPDIENDLKLITNILDRNEYSPVLYDLFEKWRALYQEYNHGMSNMSDIPNDEYDKKRWGIVKIIEEYL